MKQIRVYNQVFRIEKTVYSLQGISLPFPVSYRQMVFFAATLVLMIVLHKFPPFSWIDWYLVKFVGVPAIVAWFFTRKTLDGKAPHRFMIRYIEHHFRGKHLARYREIEQPKDKYFAYEGKVAYRLSTGGDQR